MSERAWALDRGATVLPRGGVRFSVWAPRARTVHVRVLGPPERAIPMRRGPGGVFEAVAPDAAPGDDYLLVVDSARGRPDPVSRWQPLGVHGPSRVVDPEAFAWTDGAWRGIPLEQSVLYELHVGAFTPQGTFDAAIEKLGHLRDLGVTAIELMPIASFPGDRNWGYDGVCPYAPHAAYGGPEGLKRLVDASHRAGLAVVLDVVYNHLGPEGNYLAEFGPYFSPRARTPWGEAVAFDGPDSKEVRRYAIDNALYWLTEHHVDALRLDAVHAIFDSGPRHILEELRARFAEQASRLGRLAYVVAESDLNDVRLLEPRERGGLGLDAQWSDDLHRALYALLTGARHGPFADFGSVGHVARALTDGFVLDGGHSRYRGRAHGSRSTDRPGEQFVVFLQNHDQIANASQGRRVSSVLALDRIKVATLLVVCAPNLPLFFMGQEHAETAPFVYFTSHGDPTLARAVGDGRRREYRAWGWDREPPNPQSRETFESCKLDWDSVANSPHAEMLAFHTDLLALRRECAALANCRKDLTQAAFDERGRWLVLYRGDPGGGRAAVVCNLGPDEARVPLMGIGGNARCALWTGDARYGGRVGEERPNVVEGEVNEVVIGGWTGGVFLGQGR